MARVRTRTTTRRFAVVIAQVAALALVVGGLVAFVATQRGAELSAAAAGGHSTTTVSDSSVEGESSAAADLSSSVLNLDRASEVTAVELPKVVTVTSGGYERSFATVAGTIGEALSDGQVDVDDNDKVSPSRDTKITEDVDVTVQRVETSTTTTTEDVPFETIEVEDDDLAEGRTTVLDEGRAGQKNTTWTITTVDGQETDREVASTEIVREPVDRRIAVGTQEPTPAEEPAAEPEQAESSSEPSESSSQSSTQSSTPSGSGVWQSLAQCESGGNWSINTGNGYYGGLQFSASSWAGAGGTQYAPLPHQATPAEQVATAEVLRANGGWGHWPACSASLGLR
ncbi:transglycosylase family protein [Citricoccus sp. GCM10030269]|uniref:transglycosylase family protein n=1 Tax=Citricoccus sp. GCM10030269 TaxID=3273388 RepID=UPI003612E9B3